MAELNDIYSLIKKLNFTDVSEKEIIKYKKTYETSTYHFHEISIFNNPFYQPQIIYVHMWGYGLDDRLEFKYNISDEKGLLKIINILKKDFEKELRLLKIQNLLLNVREI